ncbi:hypothetical protein F4556_005213 [Kitasatospora gansuensis]|uniref:DNA-binding protein n=1 Tax=Kitasatospora gansuensis TaxID=258050 RepID=A0A7W7WJY9_9ACTN|nr:helix-turn-helix domain-containing protein [Kitasatospora gansuensis]MBB4949678.1 hypothetical protein [Kitasatospora gansuensis]
MTELAEPPVLTAADRLRLYTPEEVIGMKLLAHSVRTLKDLAYAREIPHTRSAGKVMFRLDHILKIQLAGDVDPATRGQRHAA